MVARLVTSPSLLDDLRRVERVLVCHTPIHIPTNKRRGVMMVMPDGTWSKFGHYVLYHVANTALDVRPAEIAKALGVRPNNVSRAIKEVWDWRDTYPALDQQLAAVIARINPDMAS